MSPNGLWQILNLPTSSTSGCWVVCWLQGYFLYRTSGFSCLSFECLHQWPVITLWETRDQRHQNGRLWVVILRRHWNCLHKPGNTLIPVSVKWGWLAYTTYTVCDICTFAVLCSVTQPFCRFTRVYEGHFVLCYKRNLKWYWTVRLCYGKVLQVIGHIQVYCLLILKSKPHKRHFPSFPDPTGLITFEVMR